VVERRSVGDHPEVVQELVAVIEEGAQLGDVEHLCRARSLALVRMCAVLVAVVDDGFHPRREAIRQTLERRPIRMVPGDVGEQPAEAVRVLAISAGPPPIRVVPFFGRALLREPPEVVRP
jgi:hypothetical protein